MTDPTPSSPPPDPGAPAVDAAPKPTFDALALTPEVKKALVEMGYVHPTPVQLACFDTVVRGKDVKVQARTGTGKTTAFGLPLVDQIVRKNGGLQALCLCPTRELALQVGAELAKLGKYRGIKVCAVYGGAPMGRQIAELEEGAQIVVGTPGRVLDHLRRGTMEPKAIRALVLDEADEMLSMGFEKELNAIVDKLPKQRQTMLFSATLSSDVGRLARQMNEPETILLSGDQVGALELTHYFYLQTGDKVRNLLRILEVENPPSAICFCNTKDDTERVAKELRKAGYDADYLSGDLEQREREKVMAATREGRLRFLVATDVAARGIDISHVTHVINVDFPETPAQYVHRTGRTGRAGRTGTAISLIAAKDIGNLYYLRLTYGLRPIERVLPSEQELSTRREADLIEKLATKARGLVIDPSARAIARRLLSHDDAEALIAVMLRDELGSHLIAADEAAQARRAKNPPPVVLAAAAVEAPPTRNDRPQSQAREPRPQAPRIAEATPVRPKIAAAVPVTPATSLPVASSVGLSAGLSAGIAEQAAPSSEPLTQPRADRPRAERTDRLDPSPTAPRAGAARDARGDRPERAAEAGDRAPRDRARPPRESREREFRAPTSELVEWSPPVEADDEAPILGRNSAASSGADAMRAPAIPDGSPPAEVATIFVNVGRRDGARPADLLKILEEKGQIGAEAVGRIRLRDRNTFVDVRPDVLDKAVEALKGASIGGRAINAEPARAKEDANDAQGDERGALPMGRR